MATAAARELTRRAFDELGFDAVSARTMQENWASRRVMEKVGLSSAGAYVLPARALPGLTLPGMPRVLYTLRREDRPADCADQGAPICHITAASTRRSPWSADEILQRLTLRALTGVPQALALAVRG